MGREDTAAQVPGIVGRIIGQAGRIFAREDAPDEPSFPGPAQA